MIEVMIDKHKHIIIYFICLSREPAVGKYEQNTSLSWMVERIAIVVSQIPFKDFIKSTMYNM